MYDLFDCFVGVVVCWLLIESFVVGVVEVYFVDIGDLEYWCCVFCEVVYFLGVV